MTQIIPTKSPGVSTFKVNLGNFEFLLKTYYNAISQTWFLDVSETNGNILVIGGGLVPNVNIFSFSPEITRIYGQFRVIDLTGDENKKVDSLGNTAVLIYFQPQEFENLYEEYSEMTALDQDIDFDQLFEIVS